MASPYPGTPVNGYDASPPPDDGSLTSPNQITWSGIKSKIGDPLDNFAIAVDTNITAAFGKTLDGAGTVNAGTNYPMTAADQGRLIKATVAGVIITTPDATVVGAPFVFAVNNQSTGSVSVAGNANGPQTVDGTASIAIPSGAGAIFKTDGTNWFSFGISVATGIKPQGYLTLSSDPNAVVLSADAINVATVYYSPDTGNIIPIFNGTTFVSAGFAQLQLALVSAHLANNIYDVFAFNNAGATTLGTGPAWINSGANTGARGTGAATTELQRISGLWVNKNTITLRNGASTFPNIPVSQATFLGSILISGAAGLMSFTVAYGQNRVGTVWNAYNRRPINLLCGDATATWSYNAAPFRAANNNSANNLVYLLGLPEEQVELTYRIRANIVTGANTGTAEVAIAFGAVGAQTGTHGYFIVGTASSTLGGQPLAIYTPVSTIGIQQVFATESGDAGGGTVTYHGTLTWMLLRAFYNG